MSMLTILFLFIIVAATALYLYVKWTDKQQEE